MDVFNERCAGLDVHKEVIYVCALIGRGSGYQKFKFKFGTFHHQLIEMRQKLVELGVDILEAGFPIASDGDSEAVDAVSREFPWANVAALARANRLDVEAAAQALRHARRPRIHTFIATSDIHLKYKLKKSRQQVLDEAVAAVTLAREYCDDVEFSAEDATRTEWNYLEEISRAVVAAGARTVNLPDRRLVLPGISTSKR